MITYITLHTPDRSSIMIPCDRILRRIQTTKGSQVWLGRRMEVADKVNVTETVEEIAQLMRKANDT